MAADLVRLMRTLFATPGEAAAEAAWRPPADVYGTPQGWLVKLDLAGVRPEDVHVSVQGRRLTVQGTRRDWCVGEGCSCYLMEISYSHFERTLELPAECDGADVRAEYRDGMLLIRIQREGQKS